jgi:signal transduction histidine kinase
MKPNAPVFNEPRHRSVRWCRDLASRLRHQTDMLAIVAHDLRHPLYRAALALDLAIEENDSKVVARNLDAIRDAFASVSRLVEDLDDYASLQTGRLRLACRTVHPTTIIESAFTAFAPLAAAKQIELSTQVGAAIPPIVADHDRLLQVVSNLLVNAMCLTPAGGAVVLSVDHDDGRACFAVSDSGPGITPEDLPHLFEHYWRGANAQYAGRGLGLAIARALVESHGGQIWADNRPTQGARISFAIPAASP